MFEDYIIFAQNNFWGKICIKLATCENKYFYNVLQTFRKIVPQNNFTHKIKWSTIYLNHVNIKSKPYLEEDMGYMIMCDYYFHYIFLYFSNISTVSTYFCCVKKIK